MQIPGYAPVPDYVLLVLVEDLYCTMHNKIYVIFFCKGEVIETIQRYNGLWTRCTGQATGIWTCDAYDSFFLGLPIALQVCFSVFVKCHSLLQSVRHNKLAF